MNECNQMDVAFHMVIHTPNSHLQPKHTNTHTYRCCSCWDCTTVPRYHWEDWWLRDILVGTCDCHRLTVYHSDDHNHMSVPHNTACPMSHDHLYTACNVNKAHRSFSVCYTEQFAKASKLNLLLWQMSSNLANRVFCYGQYAHLRYIHTSVLISHKHKCPTCWLGVYKVDKAWQQVVVLQDQTSPMELILLVSSN